MEKQFGTVGWKEFNQNRLNILNEYDRVKGLIQNRPVKTAHGVAVEAFIRSWLSEYLPKKYGVTSGYVIPDVYETDYNLYHYDVIIYNQIESPILWVEGNVDESAQGKSLAIPAKYVSAIYEVKATLNTSSAKQSNEKLMSIYAFKDYLPENFSSGSIFIDLLKNQIKNRKILPKLFEGNTIPGYWGGVVLRCEIDTTMTGLFAFVNSDNDESKTNDAMLKIDLAKPIDDLNIYLDSDGNLKIAESGGGATLVATSSNNWSVIKEYGPTYHKDNKTLMLSWSRSKFSDFAIQIVSSLEGIPFDSKIRPQYGRVFDNVAFKDVEIQPDKPQPNQPHLKIAPCIFEDTKKYLKYSISEEELKIQYQYKVENIGDKVATVSPDRFTTEIELAPSESKKFRKETVIKTKSPDMPISLIETDLENGKFGVTIGLELLYKSDDENTYLEKVLYEFRLDRVKNMSNK